ncbi:MAG: PEGA domain-containing protein [Kiritimatiellae bacterium]|nr:PEGA domain-containing protein [Kiritimatiellia bacterium]
MYDGNDWIELNNSARDEGISPYESLYAGMYTNMSPVVAVSTDGLPVVAWRSVAGANFVIKAARWDGTNWVGYANSESNGVTGGQVASHPALVIDRNGRPVVAWDEPALTPPRIRVRRWNGASWSPLPDIGADPYVEGASLAIAPNNDIYLSYIQYASGGNIYPQVYVARSSGGAWSALGGSLAYPGASGATNDETAAYAASIAVAFNTNVYIAWHTDPSVLPNSILAKRWNGSAWTDVSGSGHAPGIAPIGGTSMRPVVQCDSFGVPVITFINDYHMTYNGEDVIAAETYKLVRDSNPPDFDGLRSAVGGTNGEVRLTWDSATDNSTTLVYYVYQSTQWWACGVSPTCSVDDVFSNRIAVVVTNYTTDPITYTVTNLTAGRVWCFGVRAADTNDLVDANTVTRIAGPVSGAGDDDNDCLINADEIAANTEPCIADTDQDGMWDGWEWVFSTNNPAHVNPLAMDPLDNGTVNVRTGLPGDPLQHGDEDLDGDGASNREEFEWWLNHGATCMPSTVNSPDPTDPDTDGDGMPDGWEIVNDLNPVDPSDAALDADLDGLSNLDEYLWGTDPHSTDSDGDGLTDGDEVNTHGTDPALPDTDLDGLDDKYEIDNGTDPRDADSNNNLFSDGDMYQLGWDPSTPMAVLNVLIQETFEDTSPTRPDWTHDWVNPYLPQDLWHLSRAEPDPNTSGITYIGDHTTNTCYRYATDVDFGSNLYTGYNRGSQIAALISPPLDATAASNLFVQWNEYYSTEPNGDDVRVQARGGATTNWVTIMPARTGKSGITDPATNQPARWVQSRADMSQFAGMDNVQVRFLFSADADNNAYPPFLGWFVDDVVVFEGVTIEGWVRDVNGAPLEGSVVRAIGLGGVAEYIDGHRHVPAGKIFAEAVTADDGSYSMKGLPQGHYFVKAENPGHIAEFYDGPLFVGAYGYGNEDNPGVPDVDLVTLSRGWVDLTNASTVAECHFELEKGKGRAYLGVMALNTNALQYDVYVNGLATGLLARVWDGVADTNKTADDFAIYQTWDNRVPTNNRPDWVTMPVQPELLGDLAPGRHWVFAGTNLARYPLAEVNLREGEVSLVEVRTNQALGYLHVSAENDAAYPIWVDGRDAGATTPAWLTLPAGDHMVTLATTNAPVIAPKVVTVPVGDLVRTRFTSEDTAGVPGAISISSVDVRGNGVTGALIYVNGQYSGASTPTMLTTLRPGEHFVTLRMSGYRPAELRAVSVNSGATNSCQFALADADEEYDLVGDPIEVAGYTNIFLYSRDDDPDADGLANLFEYEQFRLFNVFLDPFDEDTDDDGMSDGDEIGYDGIANLLALSTLETNALQDAASVRVLFVGRYLAGVCNFGDTAPIAASIEGDRFLATGVSFPALPVPTAQRVVMVLEGISAFGTNTAVNQGHNKDALVFADSLPDRVDTDDDGMWDGFEFDYGLGTGAALDPIEYGKTDEDPDDDGLDNYEEFLGPDLTANTDDWTDPTRIDTDDDGIPDGWEYFYGYDPNDDSDAYLDEDGDDLVNISEYYAGTNPRLKDTDADGLPDYQEVVVYLTDPLDADTDKDGLLDGREVWDRDLDGVPDGGFFPNWDGGDIDGDYPIQAPANPFATGIDGPTDWDTDGDGMPDGWEVIDEFGNLRNDPRLDPSNPYDADDDPDGDGLSNLQEYMVRDSWYGNNISGTVWDYAPDPFNPDSDGDGMPDGWEVMYGLHPMDPLPIDEGEETVRYAHLGVDGDPDGDGLWNGREYAIRFHLDPSAAPYAIYSLSCDPHAPDTDGDGLGDGEEDRAFRAHPVLQDSDGDRVMDGTAVPDRWGEVESSQRASDYEVLPCADCTVADAFLLAAQETYPANPSIAGRLASITSQRDQDIITPLVGGVTLAGVGAMNLGTNPADGWTWLSGVEFGYTNWAAGQPAFGDTDAVHYVALDASGGWTVIAYTQTVDHFVVEYPNAIATETNHYDRALNDLWELSWPAAQELPHWIKVDVDTGSPLPAPRWGHAMTYVPVFETKNARDDCALDNKATILLDNRQVVVFGGRDGVTRYGDVWEFVVRSNIWVRSIAPLDGALPGYAEGLSELSAVSIFGYKNTKDGGCPCDNYDCAGDGFGLPKDRPWPEGADGGLSRSFDWTYVFSGWDNQHAYEYGYWFYKSTDDPRPVTDQTSPEVVKGVTEYVDQGGDLKADSQEDAGVETFLVGHPPAGFDLDGEGTPNDHATGYSAIQFDEFALDPGCDQLVSASLVLHLEGVPSAAVNGNISAEITRQTGHSDPEYNSGTDTREPSRRLSNPVTYFNSASAPFTIPSGVQEVTIDITALVQEIIDFADWDSTTIGFVFDASGSVPYAVVRPDLSYIRASFVPSYKIDPYWRPPNAIRYVNTPDQFGRKSSAMAYDFDRQKVVMFGGLDGRRVRGDTREANITFTDSFNPDVSTWTEMQTVESPPARWGHCMAYDPQNKRTMLFGGFDENHQPLNDLWYYQQDIITATTTNVEGGVTNVVTETYTNAATWTEIDVFRNTERPQPRGGAMMAFYGEYDYDRTIDGYCIGGGHNKIVLFGGTDGKTYFNDTWVLDDNCGCAGGNLPRWMLANPTGEQSQSPTPRAFGAMVWAQNGRGAPDADGWSEYVASASPPCTIPCIYLFGGRTGLIPTGEDTDSDWVADGTEHELGGPAAGRDPRVNKLVESSDPTETIPYTFSRIGPLPWGWPLESRGAIGNMESLRNDDGVYAASYLLPFENHEQPNAVVHVLAEDEEVGVQAFLCEQSALWYHRYAIENPFDPRDVWESGCPDNSVVGTEAAPRYAYSGRWCYGTDLDGNYPNSAVMDLYSPLVQLTVPPGDSAPAGSSNENSYFLVFHEWLDLADSGDSVCIDLVRPVTSADMNTRVSGLDRPDLPVLTERSYAYNTSNGWRRMIVPLNHVANESNVFFRFRFQSDAAGVAGGWYLDDVAIVQGSELYGVLPAGGSNVEVCLIGENFNQNLQVCMTSDGDGNFEFGFLPLGNYQVVALGTTNGPFVVDGPNVEAGINGGGGGPLFTSMINGSTAIMTWTASNGVLYELQATSNMLTGAWTPLQVLTGGVLPSLTYTDSLSSLYRFYRVVTTNDP